MSASPAHNAFAIGTFSTPGSPGFAGMIFETAGRSVVVPLTDLRQVVEPARIAVNSHHSVPFLFEEWESTFAWLAAARDSLEHECDRRISRYPLSTLSVLCPYVPRQILCVGANYRTHVIDMLVAQPSPRMAALEPGHRRTEAAKMMDERAATGSPYAFSKLPSCVTGPYDPLRLPFDVQKPDWELELAVVIGQKARHISRNDAMKYVAGYAIVNDVTARDRVYRPDIPDLATDFLAGKSSPGFLPFGPWITPRAFVDYRNLSITLKLNGELMQDGNTGDMVFDVPRQIEYLSNRIELWPGDLICTGSPAGNGMHHHRFLQPGDKVEGCITGLGTTRNLCVLE
jgi:2,4-didehydro-3-deoxy-L-rhamnonate hydrolase